MDVEWDPNRARLNVRKHHVHFLDAFSALEDESALTMAEEPAGGDERWIALGAGALRLLKETTKAAIRFALDESELLVGLRGC